MYTYLFPLLLNLTFIGRWRSTSRDAAFTSSLRQNVEKELAASTTKKAAEGHCLANPKKTLELMNAFLSSAMAKKYREALDNDFWGCVAQAGQPEGKNICRV